MTQKIAMLTLPFQASGAVTACRAVGFNGAQATVQGQKVMGVSSYAVASGDMGAADAVGTGIIECGGNIAVGDSLICDSQGRAIKATGALAIKTGATPVTSTAANGATVLQGADLPEFVFADALEAGGTGDKIEVLFRR